MQKKIMQVIMESMTVNKKDELEEQKLLKKVIKKKRIMPLKVLIFPKLMPLPMNIFFYLKREISISEIKQ